MTDLGIERIDFFYGILFAGQTEEPNTVSWGGFRLENDAWRMLVWSDDPEQNQAAHPIGLLVEIEGRPDMMLPLADIPRHAKTYNHPNQDEPGK